MAGRTSGRVTRAISHFLLAAIMIVALGTSLHAQSSLDKGTPAESKGGTSTASTYAPDKLETVNLANGNLSLQVPLATVGGRGQASYTIALSYNSKLWSTEHEKEDTGTDPFGTINPYVHHYYAWYDDQTMASPNIIALGGGWRLSRGPALKAQRVNIDPHKCTGTINSHNTCYTWTLTKMWLTLPDGSEVELRDQYTQGAPHYVGSQMLGMNDRWRGRVWVTTDGSAATYVSDADNGAVNGQLAGWVFLADGTRLRMEGPGGAGVVVTAGCTRIVDRNGNFVTIFTDTTTGSTTYTDELGRQTVIGSASPSVLTVTVKGYGGVPDHVISVSTDRIGAADASGVLSNLRADFRNLPRPFTTGDYARNASGDIPHLIAGPHTDLFLGSESMDNVDDHYAVTRLDLPDGHSLRFRYNQYGEVAEVVYPGGGVSQIEYQGFQTSVCEGAAPYTDTLDRRVSQRRLMTDGSTVDATWSYAHGTGSVGGVSYPTGTLEARAGAGGALLLSEVHYFLALKAEYKQCRMTTSGDVTGDGTGYERWDNAKEFRVERQTGAGTEVTVRQWEQRAPVAYLPEPNAVYGQEQPSNDPRMVWEETTLENGKKKRVEYTYDDFNNVTSEKDYDFGDTAGSTGALLRQTFRTYATSVNGYCYTNLSGTDGSCGGAIPADAGTTIHQRRLLLNQTVKDGAGNQDAYSEIEYDNYSSDGSRAPLAVNSGMVGYDGARFANFTASSQPRGNATRTAAWAGGSSYLYAYARYDDAGNVVSTKDARQIESFVSYADQFADGVGRGAYAFATSTTSAAPDPTNQRGTNTPLTSSTTYEYATGQARSATDANGKTTSFQYVDPLNRPTRVDRPDGGWTEYYYGSNSYGDYVRARSALDAARYTESYRFMDGFGRGARSFAWDGSQWMTSDTQYDALGRVWRASNPYLSSGSASAVNPSGRWTTSAYDLAGRVTTVTTPDGAVVTSSYSGSQVTVTDQAGKQRRSVSDGLGRLTQVVEDPTTGGLNYATNYSYDARGNLRKVDQGGQLRYFMYDSLSRLIRARNPEQAVNTSLNTSADPVSGNTQWSMAYGYDNGGNLTARVDARNVTTTYIYDQLNRLTQTDYSDGTATKILAYDFAAYGRGRFYYAYDNSTSGGVNYVTNYDAVGRPTRRQTDFFLQGTGWVSNYASTRIYDLAGNVTTQTYPSGHTVTNTYDAAGRLSSFAGNLGDGAQRSYSSGVQYDEAGRMTRERFGTQTPLYRKSFYNVRGQLFDTRLSSVDDTWDWNRGRLIFYYSANRQWGQSGADNNGNLLYVENWIPPEGAALDQADTLRDATYTYDSLNRLASVSESMTSAAGGWVWAQQFAQGYSYDRYGNRQINAGATWGAGINNKQFTIDASTNRLYSPAGGMGYDNAGNLTQDVYSGHAAQRAYDGENRMLWEQDNTSGIYSRYTYDGEGKRARRDIGGQVTWQIYGFDGELLAEYAGGAAPTSPQKEYGYRGGELLVTAEAVGTVNWLVSDHLGTPRMVADQTGSLAGVKRHDYLPFGEEVGAGVGGRTTAQGYNQLDSVRQGFTGYEKDTETGLNYAHARYQSPTMGRFTSTDPILIKDSRLSDPQQLNLYAYARNNPLKYIDPNGEDVLVTNTREYEFTIEKRDKDNPKLLKQVTVSVAEITKERYSNDGKLIETSFNVIAKAENTTEANLRLTDSQLATVGKVTAAVVEEAAAKGVPREIALTIAAKETFLGTDPRRGAKDFQKSDVNPMQLSMNRANTDLRHNIQGGLDVYLERSKNQTLPPEQAFQRYGPQKGNAGGATYGADAMPYYNQITKGIQDTIRQTQPTIKFY